MVLLQETEMMKKTKNEQRSGDTKDEVNQIKMDKQEKKQIIKTMKQKK